MAKFPSKDRTGDSDKESQTYEKKNQKRGGSSKSSRSRGRSNKKDTSKPGKNKTGNDSSDISYFMRADRKSVV